MRNRHQISRSAELESLSVFREFIEKECKQHKRIDEQICYDLKLAVDEACTNIITHGYAGMNPGSIILYLEMKPNEVVVTITDFGHPFEPSEASVPDVEAGLEDQPMGGFGLFFIYETMDEISYETKEDGNRLTFIKKLPA
jgi:anti-sigma regulatory factor (Ser/Thr protein kinase)